MQKLIIRIIDGKCQGHPILFQNFLRALPSASSSRLPEGYAEFIRADVPPVDIYEVAEPIYELRSDGVVQERYSIRPMTEAEVADKQRRAQKHWADTHAYKNWIFNEQLCCFLPPSDPPTDGKTYRWDEVKKDWVDYSSKGLTNEQSSDFG